MALRHDIVRLCAPRNAGECAEINWRLFGLSMPWWVLFACVGLGIWTLWVNVVAPSLLIVTAARSVSDDMGANTISPFLIDHRLRHSSEELAKERRDVLKGHGQNLGADQPGRPARDRDALRPRLS